MLGYVSGPTEWYDCVTDVMPETPSYAISKGLAQSWTIDKGGLVGLSLFNADSGPNGLPTHPFRGRMSYPTINGEQTITGNL